jgi:hypothetical protein
MPRLTRTPGQSYAWMLGAMLVVVVLFNRWQDGMSRQRLLLWWASLIVFLLLDFLFLLVPIRQGSSIRRLTPRGRLWAALVWWTVLAFIAVVVPSGMQRVRREHPLLIGSVGLFFVVVLVYGILQLSKEWRDIPTRFIVAAESGGFIVNFPASDELTGAVQQIPGILPTTEPGAWAVPADVASTIALLQFAKTHDFDFLTGKHNRRNLNAPHGQQGRLNPWRRFELFSLMARPDGWRRC